MPSPHTPDRHNAARRERERRPSDLLATDFRLASHFSIPLPSEQLAFLYNEVTLLLCPDKGAIQEERGSVGSEVAAESRGVAGRPLFSAHKREPPSLTLIVR